MANSLATTLEMIVLLVLMSRRLNGIQSGEIIPALWQTIIASLVMFAGLWVWLQLSQNQPAWIIAVGGALVGGALYIGTAYAIGIREVRLVVHELNQRIRG